MEFEFTLSNHTPQFPKEDKFIFTGKHPITIKIKNPPDGIFDTVIEVDYKGMFNNADLKSGKYIHPFTIRQKEDIPNKIPFPPSVSLMFKINPETNTKEIEYALIVDVPECYVQNLTERNSES